MSEVQDNYKAIVVTIKTRPHPNADRLLIGRCVGTDVIVGTDTTNGQLGVFFDADGQLSEEFAAQHDLVTRYDANGKRSGGFFSSNRRVRAQSMRGVKSCGFWMPLDCLDYTGVDKSILIEGFEFSELNGHPICNKYFTPKTQAAQQRNQAKQNKSGQDLAGDVRKVLSFPKHLAKTQHLYRSLYQIPTGALIHVTEKEHGTSGRFGYIPVQTIHKPKWKVKWNRLVGRSRFTKGLGLSYKTTQQWQHINGSRNVTLLDQGDTYYGKGESFRQEATKNLVGRLHKGEILYFELVGWANEDGSKTIMPICDPKKLEDKSLAAKLNNPMIYKYNLQPGECDLYVYRITIVNEDNVVTELPWTAVKARCSELKINYVPELIPSFIYNGDEESLQIHLDQISERYGVLSSIDKSHLMEGFCLRAEYDGDIHIFKHKTEEFKILESAAKDQDTYEDMEEVS